MASKKLIKESVRSFGTMMMRKMSDLEIANLEDLYFTAFRMYPDEVVKNAVHKYIMEGEFYPPRPKDVLSKIDDYAKSKHDAELIARYTCPVCNQRVSAISEGMCLDCRGIPDVSYDRNKLPEASRQDYRMEGRMTCQECGYVGMCIQEPSQVGPWLCRKCYTGLDGKELAANWRTVIRAMERRHDEGTDMRPLWSTPAEDPQKMVPEPGVPESQGAGAQETDAPALERNWWDPEDSNLPETPF